MKFATSNVTFEDTPNNEFVYVVSTNNMTDARNSEVVKTLASISWNYVCYYEFKKFDSRRNLTIYWLSEIFV